MSACIIDENILRENLLLSRRPPSDDDIEALDDALTRMAAEHPRLAELVQLRRFGNGQGLVCGCRWVRSRERFDTKLRRCVRPEHATSITLPAHVDVTSMGTPQNGGAALRAAVEGTEIPPLVARRAALTSRTVPSSCYCWT
jgi:hypothetical protein